MLQANKILIGTKFIKRGKRNDVCKVIDIYKTFDSDGLLVKTSYLCQHDFMGQKVRHEECAVTIQRGHMEIAA